MLGASSEEVIVFALEKAVQAMLKKGERPVGIQREEGESKKGWHRIKTCDGG